MIDQFDRLREYRAADQERRCAMIREHYAAMEAARIARFEARRGPGSYAPWLAAIRMSPLPEIRSGAYFGYSDPFVSWNIGRLR